MVRKPWPVTVTIHGSNNIQTWFRRGSDMLHDSAITIWSRQSSDTVQTMFRDGRIQTVRPYITMLRYGSYRAQTWFRRWRIQFGHCSGRVSAITCCSQATTRPSAGHHLSITRMHKVRSCRVRGSPVMPGLASATERSPTWTITRSYWLVPAPDMLSLMTPGSSR